MAEDTQCIDLTSRNNLREFLKQECIEIERHKWIESEKVGYDLGYEAMKDWVAKYAKEYREYYIHNKMNETFSQ